MEVIEWVVIVSEWGIIEIEWVISRIGAKILTENIRIWDE